MKWTTTGANNGGDIEISISVLGLCFIDLYLVVLSSLLRSIFAGPRIADLSSLHY